MRKTTYALVGLVIAALIAAVLLFWAPFAALFATPPPCGQDTLTLGEVTYPLQTVAAPPQSAPSTLPAALILGKNETAPTVWLFDTRPLSLQPGSSIIITQDNCSTVTYQLQDQQTQAALNADLTLIVDGQTLYASLQEAEISAIPTPNPSDVLLETSLLETQTNAETVTIRLEIANYGQKPVSLTAQNLTLAGAAPQSSQPPLPQSLAPGVRISLVLTFARPTALPAELRIFDAIYDVSE